MRKSRFMVERTIQILREARGISEAWRQDYDTVRRLRSRFCWSGVPGRE
jgi:hypothetical protein